MVVGWYNKQDKSECGSGALTPSRVATRRRRSGDMRSIQFPLTQNKYTLIDEEDLPLVDGKRCCAVKSAPGRWYAVCTVDGKGVYLHRLIMDAPKGSEVDHINTDGLDNTRANLRFVTHAQNIRRAVQDHGKTSSKYRGVMYFPWGSRRRRWKAVIKVMNKSRCLGYHMTEREAAVAYDKAARKYHGEFAVVNWPLEGQDR